MVCERANLMLMAMTPSLAQAQKKSRVWVAKPFFSYSLSLPTHASKAIGLLKWWLFREKKVFSLLLLPSSWYYGTSHIHKSIPPNAKFRSIIKRSQSQKTNHLGFLRISSVSTSKNCSPKQKKNFFTIVTYGYRAPELTQDPWWCMACYIPSAVRPVHIQFFKKVLLVAVYVVCTVWWRWDLWSLQATTLPLLFLFSFLLLLLFTSIHLHLKRRRRRRKRKNLPMFHSCFGYLCGLWDHLPTRMPESLE